MEDKEKVLQSFSQIAKVIENDSSMTIKNPVLGDVVFANGTFGNLEKKNTGGFGIKHIIEGRYRKDNLSKEDITALLYLMKDTVESISPDDTSKAKINLVKNGIWVGITRNWADTDEKWIVTGYGETDKEGKMIKEAADAIKAVNAQYGYAPEFLSVGKQVGAVIASVDKITHNRDLSTVQENPAHNPLTDYTVLDVDGMSVECKTGLISGMKNAVRHVMQLQNEVERLTEENERLKNQSKIHSKNHSHSNGWDR